MKRFSTLLLLLTMALGAGAQKKALTENGEEVLLYEDGTWKYAEGAIDKVRGEIPLNTATFSRPAQANFQLKSSRVGVSFWFNSKKWQSNKAQSNEDAEYEFRLRNSDLHGMVITEKVEIPLETLRGIAVDNAREAAPDVRIIKEEYRMVNGHKILMLHLEGSMKGIRFGYFGYYCSNASGTVQFITYTSQNLIKQLMPEAEELLNGMVMTTATNE